MLGPMSAGAPAIGERVGPYRVEQLLGEGAVGHVYRAVHEATADAVALKVLREELTGDDTYRRRFLHEARAASEVRDRHLVPVVDAGEAEGRLYLAVEFVAGRTLAQRIEREGPLPLDDALRIAAHVGGGLDALHRAGIVHRDVKPANIMLAERGSAALTDFGLAKGPAYTVLTKPGQVMGTLDYLAPEVIRGGEATPASDLYAFGCVMYECVAGRAPFADRPLLQIATAALQEEPPDPCAGREDAPPGLSWALLQGVAKEPERRPPSATAYSHMLRLAAGKVSSN